MKICHVSFGKIGSTNVKLWLDSISYHTRILEVLATRHQVISFHYSTELQKVERNGVRYEFLKHTMVEELFLSRLISIIRFEAPNVIVLHGIHSVLKVFRFTRCFNETPVYAQHHGEKSFTWPKSVVQRFNDQFISRYFFSSSDMAIDWIEKGQIRSSKKIVEILEATSSFEPFSTRDQENQPLTFLWVGRIDANKDAETLLDGFIRFLNIRPEAKLFIISRDTDKFEMNLRNRISDHMDSIEFIGPVENYEMQRWMARATFIISTSFFEGSGIAVLEGMSAGCIPILTNIPSFQTITGRGKVGIVFQPGSADDLADALSKASMMNLTHEQRNVMDHFKQNLTAEAIAGKIENVLLRGEE